MSERPAGLEADAGPEPPDVPSFSRASDLTGALGRAETRVHLDAGVAGGELWVRVWRAGDRFQPLGLLSEKKLQDVFADAKVPRALRRRIPLVCNREHILWVAGLRIDHRARLTARHPPCSSYNWNRSISLPLSLREMGWGIGPRRERVSPMTVSNNMHEDIEEVLITEDVLQARVSQLAAAIAEDYRGKDCCCVGILRGAIMFMVDLARHLRHAARNGLHGDQQLRQHHESSGVVRILKDLDDVHRGQGMC